MTSRAAASTNQSADQAARSDRDLSRDPAEAPDVTDRGTMSAPLEANRAGVSAARSAAPSAAGGRGELERRKPGDGLAIGAPLTAAFIGGFLVIENLAGAERPEQDGTASLPDEPLLMAGSGDETADGLPGRAGASGEASAAAEAGDDLADPAAAPVEDAAIALGLDGTAPAASTPMVASTAADVAMPEEAGGDAAGANVSLFNISIGGKEAEPEIDADVESELISRDRQVGTPGDDLLVGTDGHDEISGGEGDDVIRGEGGSDILNGNGGDDQLFGGAGRDRLHGGAGNDRLDGGDDRELDLLKGGAGDDVLIVNGQNDIAIESSASGGAGGDDLLIVGDGLARDLPEGADGFTFAFAENFGIDLPEGSAGARRLVAENIEHIRLEGTADHDIFADSFDNRLDGNDGSNRIVAGAGDDRVNGGGGRDRLIGGEGDDELVGGAGDDVIEGGRGEDMLYGEAGDDLYVIGLNDSAIDTVFDHEGANRLVLNGITDQTVEASILGDDLYVTVDQTPVALVSEYVGHENALAGVDFGQGLRSIETLLTEHRDIEGAVRDAEQRAAEAAENDLLSAHLHLDEPTHRGDPRTDQRLDGGDGDDWLSGFDGKDVLFGKGGDDILEGGDGVDQLRGGAGDDRYLFSKGERGIDKIDDSEGRNLAELKGYDRAKIEGAMLGDDLAVLADGKVLFTVEDFATNPEAFHGVQAGNRFIQTDDLLA